MLYVKHVTVPAATSKETPVKVEVEIEEQILVYAAVKFPPGPSDLVEIAIYYGKLQLIPARLGEWITGDDETVWDFPLIEMPEKPVKLQILGCAPNTKYEHTITVRLVALNKQWIWWMITISKLFEAFKTFLKIVGLA